MRNRKTHLCPELCSFPGICHIDTTPQSIQATFTGRHETFQYTKVIRSVLSSAAFLYSLFVPHIAHTRFAECLGRVVVLISIKLQNGCSVSEPFLQDKHRIGGHTHIARMQG